MSFDLSVLQSDRPMTYEEATAILHALEESEDQTSDPLPAIKAFYAELTRRFPTLDDAPEDDKSCPWAFGPYPNHSFVSLCMTYSSAKKTTPLIQALARKHELIYLDGQAQIIQHPPSLEEPTDLHLQLQDGGIVVHPTDDDIRQVLDGIQAGKWEYTILQKHSEVYMQTKRDDDGGGYLLEHRDGSADQHFQAFNVTIEAVVTALSEFARGDDSWRARHPWTKLDFD